MRVLLAHNRYRNSGGEETHVALLEQGLLDLGIEVRRFERDSAELAHSRRKRLATGLTVVYRPGGGGIGREMMDWRPDVVHFHNLWPLLTPSALRVARRHGAAVVLTAHNYRFACPGGTLLRGGRIHEDCVEGSSLACALRDPRGAPAESVAYGAALEIHRRLGFLERWVDAFIAPSAFLGRMLVRAGIPEQRVHVIPCGLPFFEQATQPCNYAVYAGRLSEEKGVRTLLAAARLTQDVPIAVAGAGPLAADVSRAPVTYLGKLDRPSLINTLRGAAFAIVPSEWYEVFGLAALEAFGVGKPVVATALGGLPEIVQDGVTGLVIPPRSPDALAEAIETLWRRPEMTAELGARALSLVRHRYSLHGQVARVASLYASVTR